MFNIRYIKSIIHEQKQTFPDKVDHNTMRLFNIMNKYKRKSKQPPTMMTNLEITAYYLCDYKKTDLAKFCNYGDTHAFIELIDKLLHAYEKKNNDSYKSLCRRLKRIESLITEDSILLVAKNFWIGDIWYFKDMNDFFVYTNHNDIDYMIIQQDDFNELVIDPILNHYKKQNLPYVKQWYKYYMREKKRKKKEEEYLL